MKFVDRVDESARLRGVLSEEKSTLVVIYGRRRLGKSTLIKRVLSEDDIYFLADRSETKHQIKLLSAVISEKFPDFEKLTYPDWESLFRSLNYRADSRFALCIDEFPYMVEQSPDLPSVLQKLIDEKTLKYHIILCGSSQNMMYGMTMDSSSPLYGRAKEVMKLTPLRLPYIQEALNLDSQSAIEEYAIWGGVPRYWELRENTATLKNALWHNAFSVNGVLYEEPSKLFKDDIKDEVKTSTIMSYISTGSNRLSEIAARCSEPATNLSRPLKKLIDLGLLEKDIPFGQDEKNSKKSLYKISDPFLKFYYQFVVPNRSFIELDRRLPIEHSLNEHLSDFISMEWERLCRSAVTGNAIGGTVYGKASRWWGSVPNESGKIEQIEIDVVAESLDKKCLLVGECKWTTGENGRHLTSELTRKAKLLPFSRNRTIVPVLFLKNKPTEDQGNTILPADLISLFA